MHETVHSVGFAHYLYQRHRDLFFCLKHSVLMLTDLLDCYICCISIPAPESDNAHSNPFFREKPQLVHTDYFYSYVSFASTNQSCNPIYAQLCADLLLHPCSVYNTRSLQQMPFTPQGIRNSLPWWTEMQSAWFLHHPLLLPGYGTISTGPLQSPRSGNRCLLQWLTQQGIVPILQQFIL